MLMSERRRRESGGGLDKMEWNGLRFTRQYRFSNTDIVWN